MKRGQTKRKEIPISEDLLGARNELHRARRAVDNLRDQLEGREDCARALSWVQDALDSALSRLAQCERHVRKLETAP